jgi:hypothetical protein
MSPLRGFTSWNVFATIMTCLRHFSSIPEGCHDYRKTTQKTQSPVGVTLLGVLDIVYKKDNFIKLFGKEQVKVFC